MHVCSRPGCAKLVTKLTPCPDHGRPKNASWSRDRDFKAHNRFRAAVMFRSGGVCERCHGAQAKVAHHVRPGYELEDGIAVCDPCHQAIDDKARSVKRSA